ncbi:serine/threonine-protein kinase [Mycobacterium sp. 852002-51057_SCH5723018]|uniref:serine/threonine-protein kinase n=1 Tax=Mycobacterium sp. 852002-51057_SCH5723018 TaxID=1834094 RepID=UPI0007FE3418|nr:serine/threonine-protein kinase [Mycobacterium sp. 852002-51057_SCH5723018]OBG19333.1 protein kinase [Mycobacterium sp. 852002-51057_SCH5723018]
MFRSYRRSRLGTRFGPYELRSLIGAGGMGEVYGAYDTRKGRMVALKLLRPELAVDPGFQQRFRRESQLAARLQEPHVIPVHDFGEIDDVLFIDMRLVDGGSLKDLLRERGALDPGHAAAITAQVAAALDAAHAGGLVHRDVKPENVLLTTDNFAYLVDFGLAQAHGDPSLTAGGPLIGSCAYMAPERFNGGPVGPQTDVYSLACVLYECLTGQPPFECADLPQLISAHLFTPAPRPSIMRRGIDKPFDDVIARGMAKEPAARFASAGELARAACALAPSVPEPAPPPPRPAVPPSPPSGTRPFSTVYPNPDDTGFSPYPPPEPKPQRPASPVFGRAPVLVAGAAVVLLVVAAVIAATLVLFGGTRNSASPQTASARPPASSTTKTPSLSAPVQGADGLGFVGETARCDPGNPPAAVVRTAQSLAVVCQSAPSSFYYRGERIRDGAHIELTDAVRSSGGFDVTNPANGVRYEVRPERLRIISNGHVDSSEPVLEYAQAV